MQVSVETTTGLERRLTIAVPAADVEEKVNQKLAEVAKTAKINGFRKGKIPLKVVKQQYGEAARQEVASDLINSSYMEAIQQESVRPAGYPQIEVGSLESGKDLEYVATIEVYPEVAIGDFSEYEIKRLNAEINEADIDATIEKLRDQQATFADADRAAELGDQVTIDFVGTKEGEEFEGGKGNDFKLLLGSDSMIPGFEASIVGMALDEEKVVPLTFPEDYQVEELQSADVEFAITVKKIEEKTLPEVNEEFMKKFGSDDTETFRKEVKANMERELKRALEGKLKAQVMDKLFDAHDVELPKALIESEIQTLREQMMQQFGGMQQNPDLDLKALLPDEMFKEQAERRVALGLIIGEIVKQSEIKADADRVRAYIDETAASYDKPEDVVNYYYQNQQMLAGIESVVLEDMVIEQVVAKASVADETVGYEEAVAKA